MAKKRVVRPAKTPLRKSHLIGQGGKQLKKQAGKTWVDAYKKAYGKPKAKATPVKTALKSTTSLTPPKSSAFSKAVKTAKARPAKQISSKMRQAMNKPKPPKNVVRTVKRKPPTKGR